jgi:hypothetical protein
MSDAHGVSFAQLIIRAWESRTPRARVSLVVIDHAASCLAFCQSTGANVTQRRTALASSRGCAPVSAAADVSLGVRGVVMRAGSCIDTCFPLTAGVLVIASCGAATLFFCGWRCCLVDWRRVLFSPLFSLFVGIDLRDDKLRACRRLKMCQYRDSEGEDLFGVFCRCLPNDTRVVFLFKKSKTNATY